MDEAVADECQGEGGGWGAEEWVREGYWADVEGEVVSEYVRVSECTSE